MPIHHEPSDPYCWCPSCMEDENKGNQTMIQQEQCKNDHLGLLPTDSKVILDSRKDFRCRACNAILWTSDYQDVRNRTQPFYRKEKQP